MTPRRARRTSRWSLLVTAVVIIVTAAVMPSANADPVGSYTFTGAGWGHGVGMSQNGARNRADAGMTANEILSAYYPDVSIGSVSAPDDLRVHLGDVNSTGLWTAGSIEVRRGGETLTQSGPGVELMISTNGEDISLGDEHFRASQESPLEISFDEPLSLSGLGHRYYFGKLRLWPQNGKVRIVESNLSMESYVKGIAEMPSSWPQEALKAQAIAARTYAHYVTNARRNDPEWNNGYDISASTIDQNYEGYDAVVPSWVDAVNATRGVEVTYGGAPIKAYYAASNGGVTEGAGVVFDAPLPYTVVSEDRYDAGGHDWSSWTRTYTAAELTSWLNRVDESKVGQVQSIVFGDDVSGSGRIDKTPVTIQGSDRTATITGRRFMVIVNAGIFGDGGGLSKHLPSTLVAMGSAPPSTAAGVEPAPQNDTEEASSSDETDEATTPDTSATTNDAGSGDPNGEGDPDGEGASNAEQEAAPEKAPAPERGVPAVTDTEGPQQVEARVDGFAINGSTLTLEGYAVDPDDAQHALEVRVAADGVIVTETPTVDGRFTMEVPLSGDGMVDICVYARESDDSASVAVGCRGVRSTAGDGGGSGPVGISAINSEGT